jgi:hypothetical protein
LGRAPAGFHVSTSPVFRLPPDASPESVGRHLREALASYQPNFALPPPSEWKAYQRAFLKSTGFRSWRQLEGPSKSCFIQQDADGRVVFTPLRNGGSRGPKKGFQPFGLPAITTPASLTDGALGTYLLDALAKSE